jgi:hypothetical protein
MPVGSKVVLVTEVVVVAPSQGQSSATSSPTALRKQTNASLADPTRSPFTSHTQAGAHDALPTATRKMNKQSAAVGASPPLTGLPHAMSADPESVTASPPDNGAEA